MKPVLFAAVIVIALGSAAREAAAVSCCPGPAGHTYNVNDTSDTVDTFTCDGTCADASGKCTLRAAIMQANYCAGADTILVPPGIYRLTIPLDTQNGDSDASGDLDITDSVTLKLDTSKGVGPAIVDAKGNGTRVFEIGTTSQEYPVSIEGLVIRNGDATLDGSGNGGGILSNNVTLTLVRTSLLYNTALNGGGLYVNGHSSAGHSVGTLYNSTIAKNSATMTNYGYGGGVYLAPDGGYGSFTSYFSTIADNFAHGNFTGGGGGIYAANAGGSIAVGNTIVSGNYRAASPGTAADDVFAGGIDISIPDELDIIGVCASDTQCTASSISLTNVPFGPIADGDSTSTNWNDYVLPLLSGSPAIDKAVGGNCADTRTSPDERLATRPADGDGNGTLVCDLGAYEFQGNNVQLTKSVSKPEVAFGETFTYALTLLNQFEAQAAPIVVNDTLDAGLTFVSVSSSDNSPCTFTSPTVSCTIAPMASGATVVITITVTANAVGPIANTATAITGDNNPGDDTSTVTTTVIGQANTKLVKTASAASAIVGDTLTYTLTATNAGPNAASNVVVSDALPSEVTYQSAVPSQGTCSSADGVTVTCDLGALAVGATATVTVQVVAKTAGAVTNTASLQQTEHDPTSDNQPTAVVTVADEPADKSKNAVQPLADASFQGGGITCSAHGHGSSSEAGTVLSLTALVFFVRRRRKAA